MFLAMRYYEVKGHWPLMKAKTTPAATEKADSVSSGGDNGVVSAKKATNVGVEPSKEIS